MTTPLRVLHIEDSSNDAELMNIQLRRAGFEVSGERVETADAFAGALARQQWDLVIADYNLPSFDAPHALQMLKDKDIDLPFIVMSGTIAASVAVELMKAGAHDFVSKDEPARLEPIVRRELREAANRRARREGEVERERLLVQLATANRAKDEFLAMLGHELRNPLAPIVTALELMKMRGGAVVSREQEIIVRQVHHLQRLVDDLLDVARIARGKVELKRRVVAIDAAVQRGVEMASPLLEQRRHHFSVTLPPGILVDADEGRLAQVVSNLLTNAARYTPPGGQIALTMAREGDEVVLRVRDDGIGIAADVLPKIFDLFTQGERAVDRSSGGLGLGLALVRNLVELHGGSVTARSAGANEGSEFTVRLPIAGGLAAAAPEPARARRALGAAGGRRVLIVDDNLDALEMLVDLVQLEGYEVERASDGPSALALLQRFTPDIVILDIGLPVMDGHEIARRIRALPDHRDTKIVALTGYGQAADRERSRGSGFDVHLVKPVEITQLVVALEDLALPGVSGR